MTIKKNLLSIMRNANDSSGGITFGAGRESVGPFMAYPKSATVERFRFIYKGKGKLQARECVAERCLIIKINTILVITYSTHYLFQQIMREVMGYPKMHSTLL
jgi:hypothetical protein